MCCNVLHNLNSFLWSNSRKKNTKKSKKHRQKPQKNYKIDKSTTKSDRGKHSGVVSVRRPKHESWSSELPHGVSVRRGLALGHNGGHAVREILDYRSGFVDPSLQGHDNATVPWLCICQLPAACWWWVSICTIIICAWFTFIAMCTFYHRTTNVYIHCYFLNVTDFQQVVHIWSK